MGPGQGNQHWGESERLPFLPGLQRGWEWGWGEHFWSQGEVHKNRTLRGEAE